MPAKAESQRFDWVDVAKGICIVLVVMMHATFGVEHAAGRQTWIHSFIEWARPFRMPDFFLISGLFLASRIDRPWRAYLDTKVVHFAYFYVLWLAIQFAMKSPGMIADQGVAATVGDFLWSFVQPWGTLWFIHLLAVFFVVTKLLRTVPKSIVLIVTALLYLLAPATDAIVVHEFTSRYVFFFTGYALAPAVFAFAERVGILPLRTLILALVAWAIANAAAVQSGMAFVPGVDLVVSYLGIAAVVSFSVLITGSTIGSALAYCGRHSIAIYLAFTVFMGPTRIVLLKLAGGHALTLVALASTAAGVLGSLILRRGVEGTPFAFLFTRPQIFRLLPASRARGGGTPAAAAGPAM